MDLETKCNLNGYLYVLCCCIHLEDVDGVREYLSKGNEVWKAHWNDVPREMKDRCIKIVSKGRNFIKNNEKSNL